MERDFQQSYLFTESAKENIKRISNRLLLQNKGKAPKVLYRTKSHPLNEIPFDTLLKTHNNIGEVKLSNNSKRNIKPNKIKIQNYLISSSTIQSQKKKTKPILNLEVQSTEENNITENYLSNSETNFKTKNKKSILPSFSEPREETLTSNNIAIFPNNTETIKKTLRNNYQVPQLSFDKKKKTKNIVNSPNLSKYLILNQEEKESKMRQMLHNKEKSLLLDYKKLMKEEKESKEAQLLAKKIKYLEGIENLEDMKTYNDVEDKKCEDESENKINKFFKKSISVNKRNSHISDIYFKRQKSGDKRYDIPFKKRQSVDNMEYMQSINKYIPNDIYSKTTQQKKNMTENNNENIISKSKSMKGGKKTIVKKTNQYETKNNREQTLYNLKKKMLSLKSLEQTIQNNNKQSSIKKKKIKNPEYLGYKNNSFDSSLYSESSMLRGVSEVQKILLEVKQIEKEPPIELSQPPIKEVNQITQEFNYQSMAYNNFLFNQENNANNSSNDCKKFKELQYTLKIGDPFTIDKTDKILQTAGEVQKKAKEFLQEQKAKIVNEESNDYSRNQVIPIKVPCSIKHSKKEIMFDIPQDSNEKKRDKKSEEILPEAKNN